MASSILRLSTKTQCNSLLLYCFHRRILIFRLTRLQKSFFDKYKSFEDIANAKITELERDLSSLNFYKTKAKHLKESARIMIERYNGNVPKSVNELTMLPE